MAGNILYWKGVQVLMQSALETAGSITAVTKASPAVATSASHGYANGDYVLLTNVQGMPKLNNRVVRVTGVVGDDFTLEGIDSTTYPDFVSASVQKITFGLGFSTLADFTVSGGEYTEDDITTIHDDASYMAPVLPSAVSISTNSFYDLSDTALIAAEQASENLEQRAFMLVFQNGQRWLANGYVGYQATPTGNKGEKVMTPLKITVSGKPTAYAN